MNNDLFPTEDQSHDDKSRWVNQFNAREENVFNGWHDAKYRAFYLHAEKFLKEDTQEIEDVLQECFIKVWISPIHFETIAHLNNYFYRMVANGCLQSLRSRGINYRAMKGYSKLAESIENDSDLEKLHTERVEDVYQKMKQLPPTSLQVIQLSILEDKTQAETAAHLKISQTNAGAIKSRVIALLREWLGLSKKDKKGPALSLLLLLASVFC